ncbi:hypothetical protein BH23CHL3_BH23CHL3_08800 [soil metagenome]
MVSEQNEEAVNPGQAIYDALSVEAKAAVDALPDDIFMASHGLVAASWIAEAIQLANQANANCWSVLADKESDGRYFVSFIVNHIVALDINKGRLGPRFYNDSLDLEEKNWLDQTSEGGGQHKSLPISWFFVPFTLASNLAESYKSKNLRLVADTASKNWAKSAHWYKHRDEWRVKLAQSQVRSFPPRRTYRMTGSACR